MIDLHTHLLPGIDDGSRNEEMTMQMIDESKLQGVDCIVATPHFYPNVDDIDSFIEKRDKSFDDIKDRLPIKVLKGAEVQYFVGISRNDDILKLKIQGTNVILVEMPFNLKFDRSIINDIIDLSKKCIVVIAHFERYLENNSIELFKELCNYNIVLQINSNSFTKYFLRKKLLRIIKESYDVVIASDMHNTTSRPQNIKVALNYIEKKLGKDVCERVASYPRYLFKSGGKK